MRGSLRALSKNKPPSPKPLPSREGASTPNSLQRELLDRRNQSVSKKRKIRAAADEIHKHDGSILTGKIVEIIPNELYKI